MLDFQWQIQMSQNMYLTDFKVSSSSHLKIFLLLETRSFTSNSSLLESSNSAVTSSQANLSSASISQRRFRRSGLWLFLTVFVALLSTLWSTPSLQFFPWCNRHPRCDSGSSCGLLSPFFSLFFLVHSSSFRIRLEGPGFGKLPTCVKEKFRTRSWTIYIYFVQISLYIHVPFNDINLKLQKHCV